MRLAPRQEWSAEAVSSVSADIVWKNNYIITKDDLNYRS